MRALSIITNLLHFFRRGNEFIIFGRQKKYSFCVKSIPLRFYFYIYIL